MLKLTSKIRTESGKKVEELREVGIVPAVLYGPGLKNLNLSVDRKEIEKILSMAGQSSLVSLEIEGSKEKYMVLISDIDRNGVTEKLMHVDLYQPDLTKEIEAEVELVFEGESKAVKESGGTLVKNISEITVKGMPQRLPSQINVNIDVLTDFEKVILVKDLVLPEGVKAVKNPEEIIALVIPVEKVEEELEKPIEEKVDEVEKIEKEKKEEELESEEKK
ncbi:MAG TPA: 50S ribosomal protein L25 [Candidatus Paceibacterota bacterium]|nr:50S ribosomal protein L25 [Candidatus Pacearchaeota archaeon]HRZ50509.1 50S ribosomal protein L25 [Candidatus Paceibacterota bacterium]HSA36230.1 50S ribosomal protein L25 [Candidatus Paceibacterota bacterium]